MEVNEGQRGLMPTPGMRDAPRLEDEDVEDEAKDKCEIMGNNDMFVASGKVKLLMDTTN